MILKKVYIFIAISIVIFSTALFGMQQDAAEKEQLPRRIVRSNLASLLLRSSKTGAANAQSSARSLAAELDAYIGLKPAAAAPQATESVESGKKTESTEQTLHNESRPKFQGTRQDIDDDIEQLVRLERQAQLAVALKKAKEHYKPLNWHRLTWKTFSNAQTCKYPPLLTRSMIKFNNSLKNPASDTKENELALATFVELVTEAKSGLQKLSPR